MSLGKRASQHETVRVESAVRDYDFIPGQRVMTVDGYPGKITAVQDGPFRGNEGYDVLLDNGMGGGLYTSSQLRSLSEKVSDLHTAQDDYPELGNILSERPDIAPNQVLASRGWEPENDCPSCGGDGKNHDPKSKRKTCAKCDGWGNLNPYGSQKTKTAGLYGPDHPNVWDSRSTREETHPGPERFGVCESCQIHPATIQSGPVKMCRSCHTNASPNRHQPERFQHAQETGNLGEYSTHEHGWMPSMSSLHEAKKRLFGCAYCEANEKGSGNYGSHCQHCPNETANDLEAHGHTEEEHRNAQLMADLEDHLDTCPTIHSFSASGGDLGLGADSSDMGIGSGAGTGDGGGSPGCPVCDSISNGDPGGYNGDSLGGGNMAMAAYTREQHGIQFDPDDPKWAPNAGRTTWRSGDAMHLGHPEQIWTPGAHITQNAEGTQYHPKHPGNQATCPHCNGTADFNSKRQLYDFHQTLRGHGLPNPHGAALEPELGAMLVTAAGDEDFRFHLTASWSDVRQKAKGLRESGRVRITAVSEGFIAGEVLGEHHVYSTALQRMPGQPTAVATWECGCKWAAYAWGRSEKFRRFEGRMCSHALAMHYEAQSRGMFGRTINEDPDRKEWLRAGDPIVVRWDRDKKRNDTRRAVPPANMKRTFSSLEDDVSLMAVAMSEFAAEDHDEVDLLLRAAGIDKTALIEALPEILEGAEEAGGTAGAGAAGAGESGGMKNMLSDALHQHVQQQQHQQQQDNPQENDQGTNSRYESPSQDLSAPFISALTNPATPALPMTTGEEEEDPMGGQTNLTPDLEDDARTAVLRPAWLAPNAGDSDSSDIALAAREALSKMAYKDFSPGEQMVLISEGEGVRAANLDRLDIADTHYASLVDDDEIGLA